MKVLIDADACPVVDIAVGLCKKHNIQALLFSRYEAKKHRMAGGRTKGPVKRKPEQNVAFQAALQQLLQG